MPMFYRRGISVLGLALISVSSGSAFSGWAPSARRDFQALEKKMASRTNSITAGIWGAIAVDMGGLLRSSRFRRNLYRNDADYGEGKNVLYLASRTGRNRSPLVVFFPGVFGEATSSGGLMVARQVRRGRNHVLILPNPWGQSFRAARPKFMPGDFEREAKAMLDILYAGIDFIGRERISEIHFLGESYGGFLAPATAHLMNRRGDFHVKSVASVSVPFQIGNAIEAIDQMADRSEQAYFDGGCQLRLSNFFRMVGFIFEIVTHPKGTEVYSRDGVACSSGIFAYMAFQQPLFHLASDLQAWAPSPNWKGEGESYWRRKLRFHNLGEVFFGISVPSLLKQDSSNLAHWVKLIREEGTEPLALIAKDDPLNPPPGIGSYAVIRAYEPNEILVLSQGGHLGFRGSRDYRRLLRHQFLMIDSRADADLPDDALDNDPNAAADSYGAEDLADEAV